MNSVAPVALLICAVLDVCAVCRAFITQANPYVALVVLVVTLATFVWSEAAEQRQHNRMAGGRADAWARRDREGF